MNHCDFGSVEKLLLVLVSLACDNICTIVKNNYSCACHDMKIFWVRSPFLIQVSLDCCHALDRSMAANPNILFLSSFLS
jgi:hypothetical protein